MRLIRKHSEENISVQLKAHPTKARNKIQQQIVVFVTLQYRTSEEKRNTHTLDRIDKVCVVCTIMSSSGYHYKPKCNAPTQYFKWIMFGHGAHYNAVVYLYAMRRFASDKGLLNTNIEFNSASVHRAHNHNKRTTTIIARFGVEARNNARNIKYRTATTLPDIVSPHRVRNGQQWH